MVVKRTERGWGGHFISANRCLFRRNTLLECGNIGIVISTVGAMLFEEEFEEIGINRYFETMAFHVDKSEVRFKDADVTKQVNFEGKWSISELDADDEANDMHEAVVVEITNELKKGNKY